MQTNSRLLYIRNDNTFKKQSNQNGASSTTLSSSNVALHATSTVPSSTPTTTLSPTAPAPIFSYVTAKSHRMIFLLDRSPTMNKTVSAIYSKLHILFLPQRRDDTNKSCQFLRRFCVCKPLSCEFLLVIFLQAKPSSCSWLKCINGCLGVHKCWVIPSR